MLHKDSSFFVWIFSNSSLSGSFDVRTRLGSKNKIDCLLRSWECENVYVTFAIVSFLKVMKDLVADKARNVRS